MPDQPALAACPFCGGAGFPTNVIHGSATGLYGDDARAYFIACRMCAAHGPWGRSETSAVTNWNRRSDPDERERTTK